MYISSGWVVPTFVQYTSCRWPGVLGCDLHVHARPSFDAPVTAEDRVLSLVVFQEWYEMYLA